MIMLRCVGAGRFRVVHTVCRAINSRRRRPALAGEIETVLSALRHARYSHQTHAVLVKLAK